MFYAKRESSEERSRRFREETESDTDPRRKATPPRNVPKPRSLVSQFFDNLVKIFTNGDPNSN